MLKKPTPATPEKIEQISLDALVPQNHLVRKIAKVIDFEFIREAVAPLYCPNNGRPAEDYHSDAATCKCKYPKLSTQLT